VTLPAPSILSVRPQGVEQALEGVAGAQGPGGVDEAVVGQHRGGDALGGGRGGELRSVTTVPVGGVGGDGRGVTSVVVEEGQDLGVGAAGEADVGEVGLPALVGRIGPERM
jgi:hypothetical protein